MYSEEDKEKMHLEEMEKGTGGQSGSLTQSMELNVHEVQGQAQRQKFCFSLHFVRFLKFVTSLHVLTLFVVNCRCKQCGVIALAIATVIIVGGAIYLMTTMHVFNQHAHPPRTPWVRRTGTPTIERAPTTEVEEPRVEMVLYSLDLCEALDGENAEAEYQLIRNSMKVWIANLTDSEVEVRESECARRRRLGSTGIAFAGGKLEAVTESPSIVAVFEQKIKHIPLKPEEVFPSFLEESCEGSQAVACTDVAKLKAKIQEGGTFPTIPPPPATANPTRQTATTNVTASPSTASPSDSPTSAPSTAAPTASPTTGSPTISVTASPTTGSPSLSPTGSPSTGSPTTNSPSHSPPETQDDFEFVLPPLCIRWYSSVGSIEELSGKYASKGNAGPGENLYEANNYVIRLWEAPTAQSPPGSMGIWRIYDKVSNVKVAEFDTAGVSQGKLFPEDQAIQEVASHRMVVMESSGNQFSGWCFTNGNECAPTHGAFLMVDTV